MPDLSIENNFHGIIAGIDEAGRGPWAGPVVAAAVVLDRNNIPKGIDDSKKITKKATRERIFTEICKTAHVGVGIVSPREIDELNILQASLLAMSKAFAALPIVPDFALIDGNKIPKLPCPAQFVIKGDSISLSIAAASIIAKVTRDRIMTELGLVHPEYLWAKNSGYGTKDHQDALAAHGVTEHHRKTFKPIAKILEEAQEVVVF